MFHICIYLRNWGVKGAMCKKFELLDQYPQRNNLSKLATFDPILQRPHSAMIDGCQPAFEDIIAGVFTRVYCSIAHLVFIALEHCVVRPF